jgi:nucleotide-binding universal stress UspA family protein
VYKTIVVGTDGSATARAAVVHAAALANLTGASLHIVCAQQVPALAGSPEFISSGFDANAATAEATATALREAVADARAAGVAAEQHDPCGPPATCLVDTATALDADLVVVGSRGMHGTRRLLGSIPNKVTHSAPCHVLVVSTS